MTAPILLKAPFSAAPWMGGGWDVCLLWGIHISRKTDTHTFTHVHAGRLSLVLLLFGIRLGIPYEAAAPVSSAPLACGMFTCQCTHVSEVEPRSPHLGQRTAVTQGPLLWFLLAVAAGERQEGGTAIGLPILSPNEQGHCTYPSRRRARPQPAHLISAILSQQPAAPSCSCLTLSLV